MFVSCSLQPVDYEIANRKKERVIEFVANNDPTLTEFKPWKLLAAKYADMPPTEFLERFEEGYISKHPEFREPIRSIHIDVDREFSHRKFTLVLKAIGVWAGIIAILYALGFGVGWVYRGFKRNGVY
jgi:hypothetical protein